MKELNEKKGPRTEAKEQRSRKERSKVKRQVQKTVD